MLSSNPVMNENRVWVFDSYWMSWEAIKCKCVNCRVAKVRWNSFTIKFFFFSFRERNSTMAQRLSQGLSQWLTNRAGVNFTIILQAANSGHVPRITQYRWVPDFPVLNMLSKITTTKFVFWKSTQLSRYSLVLWSLASANKCVLHSFSLLSVCARNYTIPLSTWFSSF